jgi:elongation factor P--beta-lysine ligase
MKIQTTVGNLKNYKIYLQVEQAVNEFLQKKGYLKIELPVLSPALISESYLEIFETEFRYLGKKEKLYFTPSPELFLKRLLAYGVGNCYYLGKSFRNGEPNSPLHSPEFVMLEFYKVKADYMNVAGDVLQLLQFIAKKLFNKNEIAYKGKKISFNKWEKITVAQALNKYAGIKEDDYLDHGRFIDKARQKGYNTKGFFYEDIFSQIYVAEIEPHLGKNGYPTLIYDYPKEFAALAKTGKDGRTSERFEFYIDGIELGDCYSELTDWREQQKRFEIEDSKRKRENKINHLIDNEFIEALKYGLVECSGIAIGFERLAMIFADVKSIEEIKLINIT